MGQIEKGFISTIEGPADWYGHPTRAKVNPMTNSGALTRALTIPWHLRGKIGNLQPETAVAFVVFDDGTGLILERIDGEWEGVIDYDTQTTGDVIHDKTVTTHGKTQIDQTLNVTQQITGTGGMSVSGGSGALVSGSIHATGDVTAGSISLQCHTHTAQGERAETSAAH